MSKVYLVALQWLATPVQPERIDLVLSSLGDWFRFNDTTWFLDTPGSPIDVTKILRQTLQEQDSVLVMAIDPLDYNGWAPRETWDWLRRKGDPLINALAGSHPPNAGPFGVYRNPLDPKK
jgi:hypothetical protein